MLHKTGAWVSVTVQGLSLFQPFCSPNSEVWKASSLGGRGQPALEAVLPAAFHQQEVTHLPWSCILSVPSAVNTLPTHPTPSSCQKPHLSVCLQAMGSTGK